MLRGRHAYRIVHGPSGDYVALGPFAELGQELTLEHLDDAYFAHAFIEELLRFDYANEGTLRRLYDDYAEAGVVSPSREQLVRGLTQLLVGRTLRFARLRRFRLSALPAATTAEQPEPAPPPTEETSVWIELELVDEDDQPVSGEPFELGDAGGATLAQGALDRDGFARVKDLPEGTCQVDFPRRDPSRWAPPGRPHASKPIAVETLRRHRFVLVQKTLYVRLPIDPAGDEANGYKITLASTDEQASYEQTKTVADDKIIGDACLDLEYTDLLPGLSYTLRVEHEDGLQYAVMRDVAYERLFTHD